MGRELILRLRVQGADFRAYSHKDWDIADEAATDRVLAENAPCVVINCAAYTAVDAAENDEEAAFRINRDAVRILAEACKRHRSFLAHISTDFVFGERRAGRIGEKFAIHPWRTVDPVFPDGVYARSKEEGERALLDVAVDGRGGCRGAMLVRTSWVYSRFGHNFPRTMLRLASNPELSELTVVEDQIGRPTWAGRLADFILQFIEKNRLSDAGIDPSSVSGELFHFSNSGVASWYDFACATLEIAHEAGILRERKPVRAVSSDAFVRPAPRPHFSVMDLASARSVMPDIPHWRDDLTVFIGELSKEEDN